MKRLVVGDIHGCFDELRDLLALAAAEGVEEVIALGDLIDGGPQSRRVVEHFMRDKRARAILGNHEWCHLWTARGDRRRARHCAGKAWMAHPRRGFGGQPLYRFICRWFGTLPCLLELEEAILVHALLPPGLDLTEPSPGELRQMVGADDDAREAFIPAGAYEPGLGWWFERGAWPKPVIVGHHDYTRSGEPFLYPPGSGFGGARVYGLDTGCFRGGYLTGLVLPDFKPLRVRSRRERTERYRDLP